MTFVIVVLTARFLNGEADTLAERVFISFRTPIDAARENSSEIPDLQALVHALPDAVLVHRDDEIVFVNPAALNLLGAAEARQVLGRSVFDFIHPSAIDMIRQRIRLLPSFESNTPIEHLMVALDGSVREVEGLSIGISWRGEPAVEVVIRDISERKRAQRATREWDKRLELANQSGMRIGLWEWDLSTNALEWSDESYRQFG